MIKLKGINFDKKVKEKKNTTKSRKIIYTD